MVIPIELNGVSTGGWGKYLDAGNQLHLTYNIQGLHKEIYFSDRSFMESNPFIKRGSPVK